MRVGELFYQLRDSDAVGAVWPPSVWLRVGGGDPLPNINNAVLQGVKVEEDAHVEGIDLYVLAVDDGREYKGAVRVEPEDREGLIRTLEDSKGLAISEVGRQPID